MMMHSGARCSATLKSDMKRRQATDDVRIPSRKGLFNITYIIDPACRP